MKQQTPNEGPSRRNPNRAGEDEVEQVGESEGKTKGAFLRFYLFFLFLGLGCKLALID